MLTGIYKITNLKTGKFYIGSAVNIDKRWKKHTYDFSKKCHSNRHLQRAWNKYGPHAFSVSGVQKCKPKDLKKIEQAHLDFWFLACPDLLYNIARTATSTLGLKRTEETKLRMSQAKIGKKFSASYANARAKTYSGFINPNGIIQSPILNLLNFCRDNKLNVSGMHNVFTGRYKQHKGWTYQC